MAEADNAVQKFETPSESNPATEEQQVLIDHIRETFDISQITDLKCLQFARRHEVEKAPIKSLEAGLKEHLEAKSKLGDLAWNTKLEGDETSWYKFLPAFGFGQDHEGHPVFYLQLQKLDADALKDQLELAQKYYCRLYERLFHFNAERSKKTGVLQYQCLFVMDFKDVGVWGAMRQMGTLKSLTADLSALYPEVAHKTLLINCPSMVSMLVNAVKPMLGTRTKAKIMSSSNQDPLNELVWESQRPELYGGTSKKEIKWLDMITLVK